MIEHQDLFEDQKTKIIAQTAELSRLLGMIPSDGTIDVHEPMTQHPARETKYKVKRSICRECAWL